MSTADRIRRINLDSHAGNVRSANVSARTVSAGSLTVNNALVLEEPYGAINVDGVDGPVDTLEFDGAAADGGDGVLEVTLPSRPNLAQVLGAGNDAGAVNLDMNDRELQGIGHTGTSNINENAANTNDRLLVGFNVNSSSGYIIGGDSSGGRGGSVIGYESGCGGEANRGTLILKIACRCPSSFRTPLSPVIGNDNDFNSIGRGLGFDAGGHTNFVAGRRATLGFSFGEDANAAGRVSIGKSATRAAIGKNAAASGENLAIRLSSTRNMATGFSVAAAPSAGSANKFLALSINGTPYKIALDLG